MVIVWFVLGIATIVVFGLLLPTDRDPSTDTRSR